MACPAAPGEFTSSIQEYVESRRHVDKLRGSGSSSNSNSGGSGPTVLLTANEARAAADARESAQIQVRRAGGSWRSPRTERPESATTASSGGGDAEEAARMTIATLAGTAYAVTAASEGLAGALDAKGGGHHHHHHSGASVAGGGGGLQDLTSLCRLPLMLMEGRKGRAASCRAAAAATDASSVTRVHVPRGAAASSSGSGGGGSAAAGMGGRRTSVMAALAAAEERDPELQALLVRACEGCCCSPAVRLRVMYTPPRPCRRACAPTIQVVRQAPTSATSARPSPWTCRRTAWAQVSLLECGRGGPARVLHGRRRA